MSRYNDVIAGLMIGLLLWIFVLFYSGEISYQNLLFLSIIGIIGIFINLYLGGKKNDS